MEELCSVDVLTRALSAYVRYPPTGCEILRQVRARWLPVYVVNLWEQECICYIVDKILNGGEYSDEYMALPLSHRLGVVLCAVQRWAEVLGLNGKIPKEYAQEYTTRVFNFLADTPVEWQLIAIKNWDNQGIIDWKAVLYGYGITKITDPVYRASLNFMRSANTEKVTTAHVPGGEVTK